MSTGWISLHRKLQDNPLWSSEPFTRGQAWVDLILLANHEPGYIYVRDHKINLKRGDVGWSQNRLSERWQWSRTKVRKFLNDLEKEQQVNQIKSKSYTVIRLINYKDYQDVTKKKTTGKQQKDKSSTTGKQQKDTNNNVNNGNNDNKLHPLVSDYSNIKSMEEPLTKDQGESLIQEYGLQPVKDILMQMENWKLLPKKNKSANLTAHNWLKKRMNGHSQEKEFDPEKAKAFYEN